MTHHPRPLLQRRKRKYQVSGYAGHTGQARQRRETPPLTPHRTGSTHLSKFILRNERSRPSGIKVFDLNSRCGRSATSAIRTSYLSSTRHLHTPPPPHYWDTNPPIPPLKIEVKLPRPPGQKAKPQHSTLVDYVDEGAVRPTVGLPADGRRAAPPPRRSAPRRRAQQCACAALRRNATSARGPAALRAEASRVALRARPRFARRMLVVCSRPCLAALGSGPSLPLVAPRLPGSFLARALDTSSSDRLVALRTVPRPIS